MALAVGVLTGLTATPAAAASGGSATDWLYHRKWGVMQHYLGEGCPPGCPTGSWEQHSDGLWYPGPNWPTAAEWNDRVNNYDVQGVINQLKSVGAGWFQVSVGQISGYFAAPNTEYERLVPETPTHPSRLSDRDLIKELGDAAHKAGIKFIVYVPLDASPRTDADRYAAEKLGGDPQDYWGGMYKPTFQNNWVNVIKSWSQQWGESVDGWWIDGGAPNIDDYASRIIDAARSGNANTLIALSAAGWQLPSNPNAAAKTDFTMGEDRLSVSGRWTMYGSTQAQNVGLVRAQTFWGAPPNSPMNYSTQQLVDHTLNNTNVGGAMTWDVGYDRSNGHISDAAMTQLRAVGQATGTIYDSVDDSSSSVAYTGSFFGYNPGGCFGSTCHNANTAGSTATYTFSGDRVTWNGIKGPDQGSASVSIDGGPPTTVNLNAPTRTTDLPVYYSPILPNGTHTIKITTLSSGWVTVDRLTSAPDTAGGPIRSALPGGLCVDVRQASSDNGTPIQTHTCNGTNAQRWTRTTGNQLTSFGKCMDIAQGGTGQGTKIQLYTCNNTAAQVWIPDANGVLRNPQSNKCLDVPGATSDPNTQLQIYTCNSSNAQKWTLS
ncbi:ricin-type beta-trefoil lectin domain protein [Nonomuraea sp. NPDC050556]|uniref:ricin-type beta-trefoil lectin domain protein n=1 Tax=Nonomuraea sp. NPDC050556 TaxID=3364369 RepID=UPI0037A31874